MTQSGRKIALITGAARGLGYGIAERLARDGAHVVMTDVSPEIGASAERLRADGYSVSANCGSVSDEAWCKDVVRSTHRELGGLDILVNNAGISPKKQGKKIPVRDLDLETWNETFAINSTGAFLLCREATPVMADKGWGRVINISSQAARTRSDITSAPYAASKAAMIGFSRILAIEVAAFGITVNCIAPGRIESPMQAVAGTAATSEYLKRIPVGRIGTPGDVAATVAFLASPESSFLTGATIDLNGGHFMA